jgi:hypothetical protein
MAHRIERGAMDTDLPTATEIVPSGKGILVVTYPQILSGEQHNKVCAVLRQRFPDQQWLVLDGGATVQDTAAVARTEAKVDLVMAMLRTLLQHVVEDESGEESERVQALDGGPSYGARDTNQSLG